MRQHSLSTSTTTPRIPVDFRLRNRCALIYKEPYEVVEHHEGRKTNNNSNPSMPPVTTTSIPAKGGKRIVGRMRKNALSSLRTSFPHLTDGLFAVTEEEEEEDTIDEDRKQRKQQRQQQKEESTFEGESKAEGSSSRKKASKTSTAFLEGLRKKSPHGHSQNDARRDPCTSASSSRILQDYKANSMVHLPLVPANYTKSYVSQVLHNSNKSTTGNNTNDMHWVLRKRRPNRSSPAHVASATLQTDHLFSRGLAVETVTESLVRYPLRFWLIENNSRSTQGYELQDSLEGQMMLATTIDMTTILYVLNTHQSQERSSTDEEGEQQEICVQGEFAILAQDVRAALQQSAKQDKADGADADEKDDHSTNTDTSTLTAEENSYDILNNPEMVQQQVAEIIQRSRGTSADAPDWEDLINDVIKRVGAMEEQLLLEQQNAVVVLATDSINLDRRLITKLKQLCKLPVKLLIRLYQTNELSMKGLHHLCTKARLPIQVLGDFDIHHARVSLLNPWFNYALPVHRCRELGVEPRVFRILDRRLLTEFELREFLVGLFGRKVMIQAPDIHAEWHQFYQFIRKVNDMSGKQFSNRTGQGEKWLHMQELSRLYGHTAMNSVGSRMTAKAMKQRRMQTTLEL